MVTSSPVKVCKDNFVEAAGEGISTCRSKGSNGEAFTFLVEREKENGIAGDEDVKNISRKRQGSRR